LVSTAASVGTSGAFVPVNAANVTAQAAGGSVFVSDASTGNVNLVNSTINGTGYTNTASSTGTYAVTAANATGSTTLQSAAGVTVSANNIYLTSTAGGFALA